MSQYPQQPFVPPGGPPTMPFGFYAPGIPPQDPRAAGRRAGLIMIALGLLGLLCGGMFSFVGFTPSDRLDAMLKEAAQQNKQMRVLSVEERNTVQASFRMLGIGMSAACVAQVVLAIGVRACNQRATRVALSITGASMLFMLGTAVIRPQWIANMVCADFVFLIIVGVPVPFLVAALRAAPLVGQWKSQYQAQNGQFLQQQQAYQQTAPPPGPAPYSAPPAGPTGSAAPTGWQWQPPGAPPAALQMPPPPPPQEDTPHGQEPQA